MSDVVDATIARIPINVKCMQAPPFGLDAGERRRGDKATVDAPVGCGWEATMRRPRKLEWGTLSTKEPKADETTPA